MKVKVFVFGNKDLAEDSLALKISDKIHDPAIEFIKCELPDMILDQLGKGPVIILDVVRGIENTILIEDIKQLDTFRPTTMHDFDLGNFLKLLDACGEAKDIRIIGIPQSGDEEEIRKQVCSILQKLAISIRKIY